MGQLKAGIIYGVTSWKMQCRNCGYQGQPLLFDTEGEYEKFLEGLRQSRSAPIPETEEEKPDARVVDLLEHTKEPAETLEPKPRSWRAEIIVSLIVAAIMTVVEVPWFVQNLGSIALIYVFVFMVAATVIMLVVIIVLEYFYHVIARASTKKQE